MDRYILLVGLGGLLGRIACYLLASFITKLFPAAFPFGTFIVNTIGCFCIGLILGFSERYNWLHEWRIFLTTGFCGGFTTFSAFAYENVRLLQDKDYLTFGVYSLASFSLGLLAVYIGLYRFPIGNMQ